MLAAQSGTCRMRMRTARGPTQVDEWARKVPTTPNPGDSEKGSEGSHQQRGVHRHNACHRRGHRNERRALECRNSNCRVACTHVPRRLIPSAFFGFDLLEYVLGLSVIVVQHNHRLGA